MPDKYGRLTAQDWMTMGSQALSMMNSLQQLQERQDNKQYKKDVSTTQGILGANKEEGIDYKQVNRPESIDPGAWQHGKRLFLEEDGLLRQIDELKEGKEIKEIAGLFLEDPSLFGDEGRFSKMSKEHGGYVTNRAAEVAAASLASLPDLKKKAFMNRLSFNASVFQNEIEPLKNQAERLLQAGEVSEAMPMLNNLAKSLIGENVKISFDPNTQGVQLIQENPDGSGGVKNLSVQDLNGLLSQVTAEKYATEMATMGEAAHRMNAKTEYQPFKGKGGKVYMVKPIYDALNPTAQPKYKVLSENGGEVEFVDSPDELAQKGIYPENLDRELGKAKVSKENQQALKEYYHGQKYRAEAMNEFNGGKKMEAVINQAISHARDMGLPVMIDQTTGNITSQRPLTKEEALMFKEFLNANGMNPDFDVRVDKAFFGRDKNQYQLIGITPFVAQFNVPEGKPDGKPNPQPEGESEPGEGQGESKDKKDFKKVRDQIFKEHLSQYKPQTRGQYVRQNTRKFNQSNSTPLKNRMLEGIQGILGGDSTNFDVNPSDIDKDGDGVPDYLKNIYNKKTNPRAASFR